MGMIGSAKGVTGCSIRRCVAGFVLALCSLLLLVADGAQPVNATDSLADLVVVGEATKHSSNQMRLTTDDGDQVGGAWFPDPVSLHKEFDVEFSWRISRTTPSSFADGMAFVIQTSGNTALGDDGCWLGYNDLNSIAVEHDTWQNNPGDFGGNDFDPSRNHVSVQRNDADPSNTIGFTSTVPFLANGKVHTTRVVYTPGELSVSVDGTSVLVVAIDLAEALGQDEAWVGVTAATGDLPQVHDLRSFSLQQ
jgi:hypothetical protein